MRGVSEGSCAAGPSGPHHRPRGLCLDQYGWERTGCLGVRLERSGFASMSAKMDRYIDSTFGYSRASSLGITPVCLSPLVDTV
jgi:hypothetical protein